MLVSGLLFLVFLTLVLQSKVLMSPSSRNVPFCPKVVHMIAKAEGFNITELPEDIIHILLEGIAHVHLGLFLKEILINNPALSVEAFYHKVKSFNYSYFKSAAKPSYLIRDVNNEDLTGKQTGTIKMHHN